MFLIAFFTHNNLQSAQAGNQLQIHYKEIYQVWQQGRNICARVISIAIEFTLANWNLKFHFSFLLTSLKKSGTIRTYDRKVIKITSHDRHRSGA